MSPQEAAGVPQFPKPTPKHRGLAQGASEKMQRRSNLHSGPQQLSDQCGEEEGKREDLPHMSTLLDGRWKKRADGLLRTQRKPNCISLPSPSSPSPVSDPWETEKLKNNISISLWLQRYKTYKSPPAALPLHLPHPGSQMHMGPPQCTELS